MSITTRDILFEMAQEAMSRHHNLLPVVEIYNEETILVGFRSDETVSEDSPVWVLYKVCVQDSGLVTMESKDDEAEDKKWSDRYIELSLPVHTPVTSVSIDSSTFNVYTAGTVVGKLSTVGGVAPFLYKIVIDPLEMFSIVNDTVTLSRNAVTGFSHYIEVRVIDAKGETGEVKLTLIS